MSQFTIDVNEDNWQLDLDLLEEFLSSETIMNSDGLCVYKKEKNIIRAILIVHNQGNMCDMRRLLLISKKPKCNLAGEIICIVFFLNI